MSPDFEFDFFRSRSRFRALATSRGAELVSLLLPGASSSKDGSSDMSTIDIACIGPWTAANKIISIAGTHGAEAPVGAVIHADLLGNLPEIKADTAVYFVHCLNPWGMRNTRRVNEHNVDLNRNAVMNDPERVGAPENYELVRGILMPNRESSFYPFCLCASWTILRHGFNRVKQAITGGQYCDPQGLFFGGHALQPELEVLSRFFAEKLSYSQRVVVLDVHSGLGDFGSDALLLDVEEGSDPFKRVAAIFGEESVQGPDPTKSIAYHTKGSLGHLIVSAFPSAMVDYVCHEFGTRGPLTMLHSLVTENFLYQRFGHEQRVSARRELLLRNAFCPNDAEWRKSVVVPRGRKVFEQALLVS